MVYIFFFGQDPQPQNTTAIDSTKVANLPVAPVDTAKTVVLSDSVMSKANTEKYGAFAAGGNGKEEEK